MKVSSTQPFQIIYSLYQHEYLGILFESYIIQVDDKGRLTFRNQNISSKNAREFSKGLDQRDYELIELTDSMAPDHIIRHFVKKNLKPAEYFPKLYDPKKGDELLREQIDQYLERRRAGILEKLKGKQLFEMGNDGEPTAKKLKFPMSVRPLHFISTGIRSRQFIIRSFNTKEKKLTSLLPVLF